VAEMSAKDETQEHMHAFIETYHEYGKPSEIDPALDAYAAGAVGEARAPLVEALSPFEDTAVTEGRRPGLWRCPTCRQCSHTPGSIDHKSDCRATDALAKETP